MRTTRIRARAMLLFIAIILWGVRGKPDGAEYCMVEQVDPDTMWRMDTVAPPSCKTVIENTRPFGKNLLYAQIEGRVYWVQQHPDTRSIVLMEIPGPVAFDLLQSYLSGTYASDGNVLLYGKHLVRIANLPINPNGLRRFPQVGPERSDYVTDGRLVFYKERMLEGADAASFEIIALPLEKKISVPGLARDKSSVYYGADRIPDADPASFQLAHVPLETESDLRGYFGLDRTHVWHLSNGFQLVTPEYADAIRQRAHGLLPRSSEPWTMRRPLKIWGSTLLLLIAAFLIYRLQVRIRSRYQASLLSRAVGVLSGAYLVLPTVGYAMLFTRCSRPADIVVWSLLGGALVGGTWLLSVANLNFMRRADAVATTVVQLGIVTVALGVGTVPPIFVMALASIPAGISRQCPREDQNAAARNQVQVASTGHVAHLISYQAAIKKPGHAAPVLGNKRRYRLQMH